MSCEVSFNCLVWLARSSHKRQIALWGSLASQTIHCETVSKMVQLKKNSAVETSPGHWPLCVWIVQDTSCSRSASSLPIILTSILSSRSKFSTFRSLRTVTSTTQQFSLYATIVLCMYAMSQCEPPTQSHLQYSFQLTYEYSGTSQIVTALLVYRCGLKVTSPDVKFLPAQHSQWMECVQAAYAPYCRETMADFLSAL